MALIKRKDLVEENILKDFRKQVQLLTEDLKKLQQQSRAVNKTGSGSEAKERIKLTNQLKTATNQLVVATTKEAEALERLKAQKRDQNALNKANATLNNKLAGTEERLLASNTKLRLQRKKLIETDRGYEKSLQRINNQLDKNNAKMKRNADQMKRQRLGIGRYANAMRNVGKQMLTMFGGMTAFFAVIGVIKSAINVFIDFSKSSSRLAAILGKTKSEIIALTNQAKALGSVTAFTASEIVGLQTELAKLGFDPEQIENSTEGILSLAAATGHDLAESATLAGATLRIFNLDATEMSRVADVLALSTSKSALDMSKLSTALPIVGKTADVAGVSLEKTTALLGTLTNRGLDASMSATALRNVFLELSKKGLTWEEAMAKINNSTNKNKTAMELFGKRAATASIILSQTAESTDELTESLINAEGAAKEMSETMLNNLAGDITIATSAWQGFILSIEDGEGVISKSMRGLVQDFTEFLNTLTIFNETNFVNKLKIMANAALSLFETGFMPLVKILETLGIEVPKFRFEIENTSKSTGELTWNLGKAKEGVKQFTEEEILAIEEANKLAAAEQRLIDKAGNLVDGNGKVIKSSSDLRKERELRIEQARRLKQVESFGNLDMVQSIKTEGVQVGLTDEDKLTNAENFQNDLTKIAEEGQATRHEIELRNEEEHALQVEDAKKAIIEAGITAASQLANDIFGAFQDEKLARINSDAEAEKDILKQRLDDGKISEEQYTNQIAAIEKKQRIESAKADKKKALFDIAIRTAIAIISALTSIPPNVPLSIAMGIIGATQAAAVVARPIPKFAKGEIDIKGKSHKEGGIDANIEGGESIISKAATAESPDLLNMVNKGLMTDDKFNSMTRQDNNMFLAGLLMNGNKITEQMLTALLNGKTPVNRADGLTYIYGNDGSVEKFKTPN